MKFLFFLIQAFVFLVIFRFILDWVRYFARDWRPQGAVLVLVEAIYSITDPPIKALQRLLPPVRLGTVALDLAPMLLLIICFLIQRFLLIFV